MCYSLDINSRQCIHRQPLLVDANRQEVALYTRTILHCIYNVSHIIFDKMERSLHLIANQHVCYSLDINSRQDIHRQLLLVDANRQEVALYTRTILHDINNVNHIIFDKKKKSLHLKGNEPTCVLRT